MEPAQQQDDYDATFLEKPAILDKYKGAAVVTNAALAKAIEKCVDGADVYTVCQEIDAFIDEEIRKTFNNKKSKHLERGIAFPTCININEIAGHYSPFKDDSCTIKTDDVLSIDLGCHLDGFAALGAHTMVVGGKTKGKQADVILAANTAFQAACKVIAPGVKSSEVTKKIQEACDEFGCEPLHGVVSYKNKKHMVDGGDCIMNKNQPDTKHKEWEFAPGDVICLDIYASTGDGKSRQAESRTTVFKREIDVMYNLKGKHARAFIKIVDSKYPTMPFSISGFEDQTGAKLGVKEAVEHELLEQYPVLTEKSGEYVAQFKATVVVQPSGVVIIAGGQPLTDAFDTDKKVTNEALAAHLAKDLWKREEKKKEKKAPAKVEEKKK